jgi:hypothetical protein
MITDATFAPVTYTMPLARLQRLRWRGTRRSFPWAFYIQWGSVGLFLATLGLIALFPAGFQAAVRALLARPFGLRFSVAHDLAFWLLLGFFFSVVILNRRLFRAAQSSRINFDAAITLAPDPAGLDFAGREIEYILKWPGIWQLLREPDGIVLVCGGLFFLVPNSAFATAAARQAFLDHVAANLTPEAQARSETELQRARQS